MKRSFASLNAQEALQVAISIEQRNASLYEWFADGFKEIGDEESLEIAAVFWEMAIEEKGHHELLRTKYAEHYGTSICAVTHEDVVELIEMPTVDESTLFASKGIVQSQHRALQVALRAEIRAQNYYANLVEQTSQEQLRQTYRELATIEGKHATYLSVKLGLDTPHLLFKLGTKERNRNVRLAPVEIISTTLQTHLRFSSLHIGTFAGRRRRTSGRPMLCLQLEYWSCGIGRGLLNGRLPQWNG
jgi:rubrerythrin